MRKPLLTTILSSLSNRDALGTLVLRGLLAGFELVCGIVIARMFKATGYGVYALVLSWISVLAIPAAAGFDRLVIREIAVQRAGSEWGLVRGLLDRSRTIVLFASITLAVIVAVVAALVGVNSPSGTISALQIGMLAVPFVAFNRLRQAVLQGLGRVVTSQIPETLVQPVTLLALAALVQGLSGVERSGSLAVALYATSCAAAAVAGMLILRRAIPDSIRNAVPETRAGEWLRSAAPFMWMLGMNVIMTNADTILVGMLVGSTEAGIYRVASQMAMLISFPLTCVNMAVAPAIAASYARRDKAAMQAAVSSAARIVLLLTLPILGVLAIGGPYLLRLFGEGFERAYPALLLLAVGHVINVAMGTSGYLLIMTRHDRAVAVVFACGAVINVLGNLVMIPLWGIRGAAAATAFALALLSGAFGVLAWRKLAVQATLLPLGAPSRGTANG